MKAAILIGNIWATRKTESLGGYKLMLAQTMGGATEGEVMVVVDTIGAGIGDRVIIATGSCARKMLGDDQSAADAAIVGIIDEDCRLSFEGE